MLNKCVKVLKEQVETKGELIEFLLGSTMDDSKSELLTNHTHRSLGYTLAHLLAFASVNPEHRKFLRKYKHVVGTGMFTFITVEDILEYRLAGSKPIYTAIGVLNNDNKLLVQEHVKRNALAPVGGMVELNETCIEGMWRELYEETGLTKDDVVFISSSTVYTEAYNAKLFWCRLAGEKMPVNKEVLKHRKQWFEDIDSLAQLPDDAMTLTLRTLVEDFKLIREFEMI